MNEYTEIDKILKYCKDGVNVHDELIEELYTEWLADQGDVVNTYNEGRKKAVILSGIKEDEYMKKYVHIGLDPYDGKEYITLEIDEEDYEFLKECERRNLEYDEEMFWQVSEKECE